MMHLLFFLSGALGLIYEVLWMRRFSVLFGATALASTATLSGFFLGAALGSAVFGLRSTAWRRPLLVFGLLELGVALGALLALPVCAAYQGVYPALLPLLSDSPLLGGLAQLLIAMTVMGLPAFCMGATLPALAEAVTASAAGLGAPVGGLYAVNLLGAVTGTLCVPFILLPRLGADASYFAAATASACVGWIACLLGWRRPAAPGARRARAPALPRAERGLLLLSALSGAGTLALQVLCTRAFALVHENSLHAFATVLTVFLVGLAAGAALARRALRGRRDARRLLGGAWVAAGGLVVVLPCVLDALTNGLEFLPAGDRLPALMRLFAVAAVAMLPATVGLGMALPLLLELAGRGEGPAGRRTGRLLAANTLGAILGPLVVTFALAPRLGLWRTTVALGIALMLAGAATGLTRAQAGAAAAALVAALLTLDPAGVPPVRVRSSEGERLVSLREGSLGTTAVLADASDRWITVNNSYVLGGTAAAAEERWQAHLPLLLHPAPRRVAFVGLGTGITAGAALSHPVERVVALELVPEVAAAARQDFGRENGHVLDDPRVVLVLDDGRHYLAAPPQPFDVVVGDLVVPWRPGEAALYAREHFESVRRALTPEGIFCQWLPVYQLSDEQLRVAVRTFVDVFPRTTLWRGSFALEAPTLALVGHNGPRPLDPRAVDERLRTLRPGRDAGEPFLAHPAGTWLFLIGPLAPQMPWLASARSNLDSRPWIEILSPAAQVERGTHARERAGLRGLIAAASDARLAGSPLSALDAAHLSWRRAGLELEHTALADDARREARTLAILHGLPDELQRALHVPAARAAPHAAATRDDAR